MNLAPDSPQLITVILPDGSERRYDAGVTGLDIAISISKSLAKAALAIRVNGVLCDLGQPVPDKAAIAIVTARDNDALELLRHDCAHIMAQAVKELYPETQVTIGPAIDNGFYYDFYRPTAFTPEDLPKIEERMHAIIKRDERIVRSVWPRDEALDWFRAQGEHFKAELIESIPEGEEIRVYRQGDFQDLCRGPHLPSTGKATPHFKLMKLAGSYWRGDAKNAQLQRIYGTAWATREQLDAYLVQLEEAEKRDHRRLGQQMGLFHFQSEASGSVFWHDKGLIIFHALEQYIRRQLRRNAYQEVKTPQLIDNRLWEQSGHWGKFRENMFVVPDEIPGTDEGGAVFSGEFTKLMALKPMNCPAHVQIFRQGTKSYRDLPLRMAEFGCCHRNEAQGALHGLMRVRQMTQDDAHIFCTPEQITAESIAFCQLLEKVYRDLGFTAIAVKLALRPDTRAGDDSTWDRAENALRDALAEANLAYEDAPNEGAFYGPKLEFHLTDAIGRSWQCGTLQLDFVMPERLDAAYVDANGDKQRPVMLHRAILGTFERFIGIMLEHYAGNLPLWLAPVQVVVASITDEAKPYAEQLTQQWQQAGIRVVSDCRNEKITYKIREHSTAKVPYIAVVGKQEAGAGTVAFRILGQDDKLLLPQADALALLQERGAPPA